MSSSTSSSTEINIGYTYEWLNRLEQFGFISMDLLLTDSNNVMPQIRLMKEFRSGEDTNLDQIGQQACLKAYRDYQDNLTRQWVIGQIQGASDMVAGYIQSANPDLNVLSNVDSIINPVLGFYGLPVSEGLRPLLLERLNSNVGQIIDAFNQLPINYNTVPATQYFVDMVKQALQPQEPQEPSSSSESSGL